MIPPTHGVGARADLPLPVGYVVVGGGLVVAATFVAASLLWRTPRLAEEKGRPLPAVLARVVDSRALTSVLRALVLATSVLVLLVAWLGDPRVVLNLAPFALYVTFWVGLVPASLLLGPVWVRLNPLRTTYRMLARLTGPAPGAGGEVRFGYYPAAVSLLGFAWMELAAPSRSGPRHVGMFLGVYVCVQLLFALYYGEGWFTRGDGFEVYSRLVGRLAVMGRRSDGVLIWRNPLRGIAQLPEGKGLWAVVTTLIGSTAFDGLTRTTWWQYSRFGLDGDAVSPAGGLLVMVAAAGALYLVAAYASQRVSGTPDARSSFAGSLVPLAAGYAIAHYFSLLLLDGQATWILASDPFNTGLDLFGTANNVVDYGLVSARVISLVQVVAIVAAHVVGVVLAHDRALELEPGSTRPHKPWVAQVPLMVLMVGFTSGGLALLLGT